MWFQDQFVWEVKTADLTLSPRYKAAANQMEGGKGVSLRFPRFLKVGEDKKADMMLVLPDIGSDQQHWLGRDRDRRWRGC